ERHGGHAGRGRRARCRPGAPGRGARCSDPGRGPGRRAQDQRVGRGHPGRHRRGAAGAGDAGPGAAARRRRGGGGRVAARNLRAHLGHRPRRRDLQLLPRQRLVVQCDRAVRRRRRPGRRRAPPGEQQDLGRRTRPREHVRRRTPPAPAGHPARRALRDDVPPPHLLRDRGGGRVRARPGPRRHAEDAGVGDHGRDGHRLRPVGRALPAQRGRLGPPAGCRDHPGRGRVLRPGPGRRRRVDRLRCARGSGRRPRRTPRGV
ncbi:MAG: Archaeal fructose-1,6-bisphosphatase and related enzymes of inositol monophosphatase family, partial [uncultured Nocardioides sp.]